MSELTHFNTRGEAHMVDISHKAISQRLAIAAGEIVMQKATIEKILNGTHKKGDVLGIARIAGIMAAKKTPELIPLCHSVGLTRVEINFQVDAENTSVRCAAQAETLSRTGVEMEALNAVQVALLTIYDMCKAIDKEMVIQSVRLLEKTGGASGDYRAQG
ncbi:MAG: cyclic pyranopterin monophosphate synthase MoaC [Gammaproteobacteria bacterium]|nr:cyclic pyranopterin monophosphate synthase MoaC [Gammaproteobacteria bacterium]